MKFTKLARISTLVLALFLTSVAAFAQRPCGCTFCQANPEEACRNDGVTTTCAQFLTVALCPAGAAGAAATSADSEAAFLATFSEPTQAPAACLAN